MSKITETTRITPNGQMEILSHLEVSELKQNSEHRGSYDIFRRCSLAVLNVGSIIDDTTQVLKEYADFNIRVICQERGIKLEFENAPASAFVDGTVIKGIQEQLFSVLFMLRVKLKPIQTFSWIVPKVSLMPSSIFYVMPVC